jgi:hypothetical protein
MKEEIARIMKLVQDGKLSPEDAAELIDACQGEKKEAPAAERGPELGHHRVGRGRLRRGVRLRRRLAGAR